MNIKCIALDLDRTTLDRNGRLSAKNKEALEYAIAHGVHVVVASGRALHSLPQDILAVKGIRYAVTSNGAEVYDLRTGQCLKAYCMTEASVDAIMELTREEQVAYEVFVEGRAYAQRAYVADPVAHGAMPEAIPYIQSTRCPVEDFTAFLTEQKGKLGSMDVVVRDDQTKLRLWKTLQEQVEDIYITSSVKQLLEISYKDCGKHSGVRFLLDYLGLKREELAAFGDGDNDAELLRFAGMGFAMENASPGCKAAADLIAPAHDADGVAWGIAKIFQIPV
jgi:hypothetical protein